MIYKTISVTLHNHACYPEVLKSHDKPPLPPHPEEGDLSPTPAAWHHCEARLQKRPPTELFSGQGAELSRATLLPAPFQDYFPFFPDLVPSTSWVSITSAHLRLWKQRALCGMEEHVNQNPTHSECTKNMRCPVPSSFLGGNLTIQKHCFTSNNSQLGSRKDSDTSTKPFHHAGWDSAQVSSSGRGREKNFTHRKLRYNGQWITQMASVSWVCQVQATNTLIWIKQVFLTSENSLMLLPSQPPASCDNHCSCLHYQSATQRRSASQDCTLCLASFIRCLLSSARTAVYTGGSVTREFSHPPIDRRCSRF